MDGSLQFRKAFSENRRPVHFHFMTIHQFKQSAIRKLSSSPTPSLDADVLLQFTLKKDKTYILFNRNAELTPEQEAELMDAVERRMTGLPVAYITGEKEFFGLKFRVTQDVLIPKPDTEILVENAVNFMEDMFSKENRIITVCDMCSGSGCVGISVLKFISDQKIIPDALLPAVTFADISEKALAVTKSNAREILGEKLFSRCTFLLSNLFSEFGKSKAGIFDIIVSNPPYVPHNETEELLEDGRNEPRLALDGDVTLEGKSSGTEDGLEVIRNLVPQAKRNLVPGGILILETGEYNAEETKRLMENEGFTDTRLYTDLEGQLRNVSGIKG